VFEVKFRLFLVFRIIQIGSELPVYVEVDVVFIYYARFHLLRFLSGVYLVWYMSYIESFEWCLSCMLDLV
jgi:hypothetical protein